MTIFQSIVLGIIQGLTEFLPVSSSGHLVLVPYLFNWQLPAEETFTFDVLVQVATLAAVLAFFWKDLLDIARGFWEGLARRKPFGTPQSRLGWYLILATIPAGVFGLTMKDAVESAFSSPVLVAFFLFLTAGLLLVAEWIGGHNLISKEMSWKDALWIGCAQALAIFPGVSRSGSTIVGGMTRHLDRPAAARFSFLMSIPIMVAAGLLQGVDLIQMPNFYNLLPIFLPGFLAAAIVGYLSIRWLLGYLTHHRLYLFSIYCVTIGVLILILDFFR